MVNDYAAAKISPSIYELNMTHSDFIGILDKNWRSISYPTIDHLPKKPATLKDNEYNIANVLRDVQIGDSLQIECDVNAIKRMAHPGERDRLCRGVEAIVESIQDNTENHERTINFRVINSELSLRQG